MWNTTPAAQTDVCRIDGIYLIIWSLRKGVSTPDWQIPSFLVVQKVPTHTFRAYSMHDLIFKFSETEAEKPWTENEFGLKKVFLYATKHHLHADSCCGCSCLIEIWLTRSFVFSSKQIDSKEQNYTMTFFAFIFWKITPSSELLLTLSVLFLQLR